MNQFKLLLVSFLLIVIACNSNNPSQKSTFGDINVEKAKQLLNDERIIFLDVRTAEEVAGGSIERSINIDYKQQNSFETELNKLDKTKSYVIYCQGGFRSAKAFDQMKALGFKSLYNLEGGYSKWNKS